MSKKAVKMAHTNRSPKGMGDYYGTGVKNPMGRSRDVYAIESTAAKSIKKPPKSLA